jgi:hypothetical protein
MLSAAALYIEFIAGAEAPPELYPDPRHALTASIANNKESIILIESFIQII